MELQLSKSLTGERFKTPWQKYILQKVISVGVMIPISTKFKASDWRSVRKGFVKNAT